MHLGLHRPGQRAGEGVRASQSARREQQAETGAGVARRAAERAREAALDAQRVVETFGDADPVEDAFDEGRPDALEGVRAQPLERVRVVESVRGLDLGRSLERLLVALAAHLRSLGSATKSSMSNFEAGSRKPSSSRLARRSN